MLILNKVMALLMMGFTVSIVFGLFFIPFIKKINVYQQVSTYMGKGHEHKNNTPTMGGFIFVIPTIVLTLILIYLNYLTLTNDLIMVLIVFVLYSLLGFLDDFLSIYSKKNEGLSAFNKLVGQIIIALVFFTLYLNNGGTTAVVVSTLNINIELGWFYGVFILLFVTGFSNAVNITDGLDGLAGGLSAIAFLAFGLIAIMVGYVNMGLFIFLLMGALLGFLMFNGYPAKIFMGDTGSLALGGIMAVVAILTHREITLMVVASLFIIEIGSVVLQVFWLKVFKKRLFLMTPLHHHFEKLGWHESDIVKMFWTIGIILAMAGIYFGIWL